MKTIITISALIAFLVTNLDLQSQTNDINKPTEIKQSEDSTTYELLVFDSGFESYLAKLPYTKDFYSNNYYKNWNVHYVIEWNSRVLNPIRYGAIYDNQIEYSSQIDYGLDLNFTLYHYFKFFEEKNNVVFLKRK